MHACVAAHIDPKPMVKAASRRCVSRVPGQSAVGNACRRLERPVNPRASTQPRGIRYVGSPRQKSIRRCCSRISHALRVPSLCPAALALCQRTSEGPRYRVLGRSLRRLVTVWPTAERCSPVRIRKYLVDAFFASSQDRPWAGRGTWPCAITKSRHDGPSSVT